MLISRRLRLEKNLTPFLHNPGIFVNYFYAFSPFREKIQVTILGQLSEFKTPQIFIFYSKRNVLKIQQFCHQPVLHTCGHVFQVKHFSSTDTALPNILQVNTPKLS